MIKLQIIDELLNDQVVLACKELDTIDMFSNVLMLKISYQNLYMLEDTIKRARSIIDQKRHVKAFMAKRVRDEEKRAKE
jgi:hypothetical protein